MTIGANLPAFALAVLLGATAAVAQGPTPPPPPQARLPRLTGEIRVDGDLSDPGWRDAAKVELEYEVAVHETNTKPPVRTTAYLGYDDHYFYVAFDCEDPDPSQIRAPFTDRDDLGSEQDFAGIMLDTRHDRRSALELFVNPRGIESDGVRNEANSNEDFSPDLFWDAAARITDRGWQLEMRVPFSSLRYRDLDPQSWGILLFRNYPRDYRYQIFNVPVLRGSNCLQCGELELSGLTGLPKGGHLVVAPYATARGSEEYGDDSTHRTLVGAAGADLKWIPNADTAVDLTLNPDFSQVESDAAQLAVNQRFALFYPEKRPFFLEGSDLFDTPIQAVYTRTITSPDAGARVTGKIDSTTYTALVTHDRGGGSVILPGAEESGLAEQNFRSTDTIVRLRHDAGTSFVGLLVSDRENEGGSSNRLVGPDFQWRPNARHQLTGQLLFSRSLTPDRPDLADEWDHRRLQGGALSLQYTYSTNRAYADTRVRDFGNGFRADNGFVPQVGFRELRQTLGWRFYPKTGLFSRVMPLFKLDQYWDHDHRSIDTKVGPAIEVNGKHNFYGELDLWTEGLRTGDQSVGDPLIRRTQLYWEVDVAPTRKLASISAYGTLGQNIDVANARPGHGADFNLSVLLRPGDHLSLSMSGTHAWLDVRGENGSAPRLFSADLARVKAVYVFSARSFVRAIAQYVRTHRDPTLYTSSVDAYDGGLQTSLLFAYKLNWQSVLFVGVGDNRALDPGNVLQKQDRQVFVKTSYAFQR